MSPAIAVVAAALVLTLLAGIGRAIAGPSPVDRILAAQLLGTGGVGVLLTLSADGGRALQDVAAVLVVLAATATIVWLRRVERHERGEGR